MEDPYRPINYIREPITKGGLPPKPHHQNKKKKMAAGDDSPPLSGHVDCDSVLEVSRPLLME